jgi:hypothetical protein
MKRWAFAALALAGCGSAPQQAAQVAPSRATAAVERRDLVDRESIAGTLGYADPGTLTAGVAGVLTALRDPGSVVTRGHSLYSVDNAPAAFLLYGDLPAWRDFAPGMTDGEDVRELERGSTTGRIEEVGKVATKASADADPTIAVTIRLRGRGSGLDQAPVDVGFAVERRHNVLAVPVKALLARQGGGYAVQLRGGRIVPVEPGLYADDMVEVTGAGLREGQQVVTAQ